MSFSRLVLTLLLPPLSVYLRRGADRRFWLNCVLTLLWYVPGVLHALLVLRRSPAGASARSGRLGAESAQRQPSRKAPQQYR